jgi:hypothetical protein
VEISCLAGQLKLGGAKNRQDIARLLDYESAGRERESLAHDEFANSRNAYFQGSMAGETGSVERRSENATLARSPPTGVDFTVYGVREFVWAPRLNSQSLSKRKDS